jgi:hypothetical protein
MMVLVPFAPAHFTPLLGWFPSHADLVQWGGPLLEFPLSHGQLERMLAEGRSDPPARLCWTAVFDGELAGHVATATPCSVAWPSRRKCAAGVLPAG